MALSRPKLSADVIGYGTCGSETVKDKMNIYLVGSVAYDRIMNFNGRFSEHILPDKVHVLNVSFIISSLQERFGGTAGNIAYTLALLEEFPTIIASVGTDFATSYKNHLEKLGLPLNGVHVSTDFLTASAYIITDLANCQITGFNPGASAVFSNKAISELTADDLIVISPTDVNEMRYYCAMAKEKNVPWVFDPGQQLPALSAEDLLFMITGANMLVSNDYEFAMICEKTSRMKEELAQLTPVIITTLGEHGCDIHTQQNTLRIPAISIDDVKDPTGAGDAFRAGLMKGLKMGKRIQEAAQMGILTASYVVEQEGTQEHFFTPDDFWKRYHSLFS